MFRRPWMIVVLVSVSASSLAAQDKPAAPQLSDSPMPADIRARFEALAASRLEFFMKHYALSDADAARLKAEFERLIGEQAVYSGRWDVTLRRRTLALSRTLPTYQDISESLRASLTERYQNEIYDIHLKSPMGYANLARRVETGLPREKIAAGHQSIEKEYAARLQGAPLKIEELDRIVIPPVQPLTSPDPLERALNPATPQTIAKEGTVSKTADAQFQKDQTGQAREAVAPRPAGPPPPPRADAPAAQAPIEPAPALDAWQARLDGWMDFYRFDDKQRTTATGVFNSCTARARTHLDSNADAYQKANAMADGPEKTKALASLNARLDSLYNELRRRVESIATLQQRAEAAARDQKKTADAGKGS